MLLPALPLAALGIEPPDPDWKTKKRLIRERNIALTLAANQLYGLDERPLKYTWGSRPGAHGEYDRGFDRAELDLESVHDPRKFWHVLNETLAHEHAHRVNGLLKGKRGHDEKFRGILDELRKHQYGLLADE